ncbi:MAG: family 20 glycosylhydrolase [Bacteroidales bacterium]|nr:family 20 glycosylhydrolase [Bacteroidales bacterium]
MRKLFPIIILLFVSARLCAGEVFRVRGINIDFRTQVMTMSALKQTVKDAAGEGINTLLIEWEGSFPFRCNASLRNRNSFSTQEIKDFVSWCNSLGVDVIPIQNCFGHCEYILSQPKYSHLREDNKEISQVCPSKEDVCADVFESIFREVAELHTSKYIHIGADETRLLGRCRRCAAKVAEKGVSELWSRRRLPATTSGRI